MGLAVKKKLLEEWSQWLVSNIGKDDLASDPKGGNHNRLNAGRDVWLVFGTWGQVDFGTRTLRPGDKQLFIVAGSSHATFDELADGAAKNEANLKKLAKNIDKLWMNPSLQKVKSDGSLEEIKLETIETDMFDVDIHKNSQYTTLTGVSSGPTKMVSVARACLYTPSAGDNLVIGGQSRRGSAGGKKEEGFYNVQVEYEIS
jgi:hypothetical protein